MSGLDIEALRRKMTEVKERRNKGNVDFWSPKDGRNVIRILPAKAGQEFYSESRVRYNVGPENKMVTVPLDSSPENCPIHAYVDELFKSKDKDDEKLAKKMRASNRYYFNIIDRTVGEDEEGYGEVQVFGCGSTIFTDVLGIIVDPDYGDITDPENGYDIIITKSGKKMETEYRTVARPKQTAIGIDDWEEKLKDLAKIATPKSYDERLAILTGEEGGEASEDEEEEEELPKKSAKKPAPKKEAPKEADTPTDEDFDSSNADDIEAEIQAMLNKHK